jgi:dUTP pyrophosphatase
MLITVARSVIPFNLSDKPFTIHRGDRVAQIVFAKIEKAKLGGEDAVRDSERGGRVRHTGAR